MNNMNDGSPLEVKDSHRVLLTLIGNLPGIAYRCNNDPDWTIEYVSDACFELTGYHPPDFVGNRTLAYGDLIHRNDREMVWQTVQEKVENQQPYMLEYRIKTKSGQEKWVWEKGVGIYSAEGQLEALEGFLFDITDRKAADELLRESEGKRQLSEAQYKITVNNAPVGIVTADRNSKLLTVNRAFCRMLGYRKSELLKMNAYEFSHPDDNELTYKKIADLWAGKISRVQVEKRYISKDGSIIYAAMNAALVKSPGGEPLFHVAQIEDISERKQMEEKLRKHQEELEELVVRRTQELRRSEERLKLALEGANDGLWDFYPLTGEAYYSPRWFAMLGYDPEEFPHNYETWSKLLHPDDRERVERVVSEFLQTKLKLYVCEFRMRTVTDNWRWVLARGKAVEWDKDGKVMRMVGTHTDISDRKQIEEQLKILVVEQDRANKELEDFAYIVSHDLKAPLRGISSLANWLAEDYGDQLGEEGRQYLDKLLFRSKRMHHLIEGILQYSRAGRERAIMEHLDSGAIVREVMDGLSIPEGIEVRFENELPEITYDRIHLFQVFQNLIGNAVKHLGKDRGLVEVSCTRHGGDREPFFEFCVKDNGVGIEERHFQRIFKIFQSLSPRTESDSTGIGLSLVKKIVEKNGGHVWLESKVGEGSWFYFTVPSRPAPVGETGTPRNTVLLIDDSREFNELSGSLLELEGYATLTAQTTPEALQVLAQYSGDVAMALMDVIIPGENVKHRIRTLRQVRPGMHIIACTGKDLEEVRESLEGEAIEGILKKPFNIEDFRRVLEKMNVKNGKKETR